MPDGLNVKEPPAQRRRPSLGMISFLLLVMNAAGVFWAQWVVGDGVDSGIPFLAFLGGVTLPVFFVTLALSVTSIVRRRGYILGAVTTVLSLGVLVWAVYGFLESQVF